MWCETGKQQPATFCNRAKLLAVELEAENEAMFGGEIEVDESCFGGRRKGKRGRGAAGKKYRYSAC